MTLNLILGFGISGRKTAEYLLQKGEPFLCVDRLSAKLKEEKALYSFPLVSEEEKIHWNQVKRVIKSPGIEPTHPHVLAALAKGIPVIGEIDLALEELTKRKKILFGITGSNGKTTTTLLLAHILKNRGLAVGNVGVPLIGEIDNPAEIFIVELSSFQLESILPAQIFDGAVILNITPNHLNRHPSLIDYASAKWRLQNCLKDEKPLFVQKRAFEQFKELANFKTAIHFFEDFKEKIETLLSHSYRGGPSWLSFHDYENVSAAFALFQTLGISEKEFIEGIQSFKKPPHRIEFVRDYHGVCYINDSKASNVDAVLKAVESISGKVILIAGGVDKGGSFREWVPSFAGKVKAIFAIGEAAPRICRELEGAVGTAIAHVLGEAIEQANLIAEKGDTILLSPGCSSYDQFRDYQQRGEIFKEIVFGLGEKKS